MYDPGQLYYDPILTGFSTGYGEGQNLYGEAVCPVTAVNTQSGKYLTFDRSSWLIHESRREPGTVANEVEGGKWSSDTFSVQEHSLQASVKDEELQQYHSLGGLANTTFGGGIDLNPERDATEFITGALLREHELKVATLVRNPATYTGGASGSHVQAGASGTYWDATGASGSNPIADIRNAIRVIQGDIRKTPNVMLLPRIGASYLEEHTKIIDRYKNFTLSQPDAFRILTGFEGTIYLVDSVYNSADNVDVAENIVEFWGKDVWIGYVDPAAGQRTRTFAKTFAQTYPSGDLRPTERWREEPRKCDVIRTSYKYDLKVISPDAGFLFDDIFSSAAW
jgi:hypothetical protein